MSSYPINEGPMYQPPEGFPFTADSALRRHAEPAALALFPFIAGMAVMNDQIAAAVERHSDFTEHPWGRLFRTARIAAVLVFGDEEESLALAEKLWHFHETIRGTNDSVDYDANNAVLQTRVLASVFKGLDETARRWTKPLGTEREALYQDIRIFGEVFGVKTELMPPDVEALDDYWEEQIDGDFLLQGEISKRMARIVFSYRGIKFPPPISIVGHAMSKDSIDPRLRERSGIVQTPMDHRIAQAFDWTMRHTYGKVPKKVRERAVPGYLTARRRAAPWVGRKAVA